MGGRAKAAILAPVTFGSRTYEFQLDTGADLSFIPEAVAVEAGLMKAGAGGARAPDVKLGGASLGPRWLLTRGSVGTIGLDMLVGYTTVIDYPAQRLCITPTADLPFGIYKGATWTNAVLRDGKLFVPVEIGGERRSDYFFDTGASLFPVSVDLADWRRLTGRQTPAETDTRISGKAWGARVELIGAPSAKPITIGSLSVGRPDVFHDVGAPDRFAKYPFQAGGLIGNAGLWNSVVVLSLSSRPQFGVLDVRLGPR
jgi:hypothetical protein